MRCQESTELIPNLIDIYEVAPLEMDLSDLDRSQFEMFNAFRDEAPVWNMKSN